MIHTIATLTGETNHVTVWFDDTLGMGWVTADADIDADGANGQSSGKGAYHPSDRGLDFLANAGYPNSPDSYKNILVLGHNGKPIVQGEGDPAPGYFISKTSYRFPNLMASDPRAYLDAETVPFIVVSPLIQQRLKGVILGCKARAVNIQNGRMVDCMVGDIGPTRKMGELSIAAAKALGIPSSPKDGGTNELIVKYEFWPDIHANVGGQLYALQTIKGVHILA